MPITPALTTMAAKPKPGSGLERARVFQTACKTALPSAIKKTVKDMRAAP